MCAQVSTIAKAGHDSSFDLGRYQWEITAANSLGQSISYALGSVESSWHRGQGLDESLNLAFVTRILSEVIGETSL